MDEIAKKRDDVLQGHAMNPWEIAARVCRPMSSEEAMNLVLKRYGSREMADTDPLMEAEIKEKLARIERAEREERDRSGEA